MRRVWKEELLRFSGAAVRFCHENPLALDCLIGETEAIIAFPDRATYPHLGVALIVRDREAVESLRQWYRDFIWESPVAKTNLRSGEDLREIDRLLEL